MSLVPNQASNNGSYTAGADLSSSQYCFVKAHSVAGQVVLCGAGEAALGILQNAPKSGEAADVALPGGGAKLKVAAALAPSAKLKSDASGNGVAATTTDRVFAVVDAIGANSASGDIIPVFVHHGFLNAVA